jgi:UDPglucose 6-dehydrogenase
MRVVIIGTGYVGLVQGVCLAELGNQVVCIDIDKNKINKLQKGISPIYEPGIEELITQNVAAGRLQFDTNLKKNLKDSELIFIAVGTPSDEDGRADLKYVISAAEEIGRSLTSHQVVINKSTVPIGTGQLVKKTIKQFYKGKFDVVSNPEFLKEGSAIDDFMHPDRIVIGFDEDRSAADKVAKLYEVLGSPILITNLEAAEMIKYASNSFLATQISFINSVAEICEKVGADVTEVAAGMKLDKRIGKKAFLNAGLGYGGSCFPKDVQALVKIAKDNDADFTILEEVEAVNKSQRQRFVRSIQKKLGEIKGKKIGVWGIAFKPKTDDIREAPSITIIEALQDLGAKLVVFDPVAEENTKRFFPDLGFAKNPFEACKGADALVIITEWNEFKQLDLNKVKKLMKEPVVFDGRNIYQTAEMKKLGFKYYSIGR